MNVRQYLASLFVYVYELAVERVGAALALLQPEVQAARCDYREACFIRV